MSKKLTRNACQGNRAVIADKRPVTVLEKTLHVDSDWHYFKLYQVV